MSNESARLARLPLWRLRGLSAIGALAASIHAPLQAAEGDEENWNLKGQSTYIFQHKSALHADYTLPDTNSLRTEAERSYSFTATLALGWRPWRGGELYFDPEVARGHALSDLTGLGGLTNGEMARSSGAQFKLYRARLFLRQTWNDGGERQTVESAANQLAGSVDSRRWVLTVGTLSVLDVFDNNSVAHDPRTQFLNWSLMTHGSYDFPADARGYTWGAAVERYEGDWALRWGRFALPKQPNGQPLDPHLLHRGGDQIELQHDHHLGPWFGRADDALPGSVRMLAFWDRAVMTRFRNALAAAAAAGTEPTLDATRHEVHTKRGVGVALDQTLPHGLRAFARLSRADGQTETYAFTEIDQAASAGLLAEGDNWGRHGDSFGLAYARNTLSGARRDYLAAGGISFFIGDGRLSYRAEQIWEAIYSLDLGAALAPAPGTLGGSHVWLSADWQHIAHPAYNADRGPVRLWAARLHAEF